jgi:hypothetical protein
VSPSSAKTFYDSRPLDGAVGDYDDDDTRPFSPGYAPQKDSTIRAIKPQSREGYQSVPSSRQANVATLTPSISSPAAVLSRHGSNQKDGEDTFLQESSGNEDRSLNASRPQNFDTKPDLRRPKTSPTTPSFVKDLEAGRQEHPKPTNESVEKDENTMKAQHTSTVQSECLKTITPKESRENSPYKFKAGKESQRLRLEPRMSEEGLDQEDIKLSPPLDSGRHSGSTTTEYKSATSLPIVQIGDDESKKGPVTPGPTVERPEQVDEKVDEHDIPTANDREQAYQIWIGSEEIVSKSRAAAWLGDDGSERKRIRRAYMELYDWSNMNILAALRDLCGRLVLKAETQQVDRILESFSLAWCDCNPHHGFKVTGECFLFFKK